MKRKVLSVCISLLLILTLIPIPVSASGDDSGVDIDNAFPVTNATELTAALLETSGYAVIELVGSIDGVFSFTIPSGKTLIIRENISEPTVLSCYAINISPGGVLINEGGIRTKATGEINVSGTFQNSSIVTESRIRLLTDGTLSNFSDGVIDSRSVVHVYGGTLTNEGSVQCSVYTVGDDVSCTITGIGESQISATNTPIDYTTMVYTPISLPGSDTVTLGLNGSTSQLVTDNDGYEVFAKGYSIYLEEGQVLTVQTSTDFRPSLYFMSDDFNVYFWAYLGGLTFAAEESGTYLFMIGGYNSFDEGTFTVTVYESSELLIPFLDFTASESDPMYPGTEGDGWIWDPTTSTLTLDGICLDNTGASFLLEPQVGLLALAPSSPESEPLPQIILPNDSRIVLQSGSDNFIRSNMAAILCIGNLTISGGGNLTINSSGIGIFSAGILTLETTGSVSVSTDHSLSVFEVSAVCAIGGMNLFNCADVTVYGEMFGLCSGGEIQITNSTLHAFGEYFAIHTMPFSESNTGGDIIISCSDVYAYCLSDGNAAIFAGDNLLPSTLEGHSKLIITDASLTSPEEAHVVDVNILSVPGCQTVTAMTGISSITSWSQSAKTVRILPLYNILYNGNGGAGSLSDSSNAYLKFSTVTVLDNTFVQDGSHFDGWNTEEDGSGTSYESGSTFSITNGLTLYAQWAPNQYTVTFVDWDGTVLSTQIVGQDGTASAPSTPTRSGYTFTGWDVSFDSVTSDLTVTAQYDPDTGGIARTGETGSNSIIAPILLLCIGMAALGALVIHKKKELPAN